MSLEITVQIKRVYGEDKIYPVCDKALVFAKLTGNKTLTFAAIEGIKKLGYVVNVQPNSPATL